MRLGHLLHVAVVGIVLSGCAQTTGPSGGERRWVSFPSGGKTLSGFLSKPKGAGPFKAIVFNHGSEREPGSQLDLAAFYNKHGFVFFLPHRTGHGRSPGADIRDRMAPYRGKMGFRAKQVQLLEADNADAVAAVEWLKARPFVDPRRIVMSGYSFGGIQTLLTAEKGAGVRAFISFTPAAMAWRNRQLRTRLLTAIEKAKAPMFLIQAENDFSTGPSQVLGPAIRAKGPPSRAKLYPPFGSSKRDAHARFPTRTTGTEIWGPDVLSFVTTVLSE